MSENFRPLEGIRVVEMSHMVMGPSCGMFLATLGAEVIKVEPVAGDKTRYLSGMGRPLFPLFNRGKKSVRLDTESHSGRTALDALLSTADVFIDNFSSASLAKMGLNADAMRGKFPRLILASHKGFLAGPYEHRTALDEVVQMMTGLAYMTGPTGRPLRVGASVNDIMGGLFGAFTVVASLMERKRTGRARSLRIGLFENALLLVAQHMVQFELEGQEPLPMPERTFAWPVYDIFQTADNHQIFVAVATERHWRVLCDVLGLVDLAADPTLQTKGDQIKARPLTLPVLTNAIRGTTLDTLRENFEREGIPYSPVARPKDMYSDPHVLRPGGLVESVMPEGGAFRAPSLPVDVDGLPIGNIGNVPAMGEHTDAILSSLGFDKETIEAASGATEHGACDG
ncbi:CaiB/BaiF CoA transferase family protein [Bradyrhizobium diversitatis]|uniref:CoA transferase n=1 Tax=Bradyrhizobium diversitatis TaxID=2755406 RepID=A0ABS0PBK6_9BRAD|nr:CaiB/BaiF CoA-transferase family protein [Bradyrhizobium diversitatis]MBH5390679.1 CoA transferase [Bradyrhizobium diversitatis]